jgi:hypothetical protein
MPVMHVACITSALGSGTPRGVVAWSGFRRTTPLAVMRPICITEEGAARLRKMCIGGRPPPVMRPICITEEGAARLRKMCIGGRPPPRSRAAEN